MKSKITPISDIVKTVFERFESERTFSKEDIEGQWKELVGDTAAKHTRPAALRKGALTVFVDSSGWMQEMVMKKRKILKQLKMRFGKDRISGIHFRIGET
jgi:predicted nucleic acid-binding Zn ribbon protein